MSRLKQKILTGAAVVVLVLFVGGRAYVRAHPLVFNESFFQHAHCAPQVGSALLVYGKDHQGAYPVSTNGYGDALLLLLPDFGDPEPLTGPGYNAKIFSDAYANKTHVPESECGRVYIQGLREDSDPEIAIFFDKLPNPGDHCHGLRRIWAPMRREVIFVDGWFRSVLENDWPTFASNQVELLVKAGIPRATAVAYYSEKPKPR